MTKASGERGGLHGNKGIQYTPRGMHVLARVHARTRTHAHTHTFTLTHTELVMYLLLLTIAIVQPFHETDRPKID